MEDVSYRIFFIFLKDGQERTEEVVKIEWKMYILKEIINKRSSHARHQQQ